MKNIIRGILRKNLLMLLYKPEWTVVAKLGQIVRKVASIRSQWHWGKAIFNIIGCCHRQGHCFQSGSFCRKLGKGGILEDLLKKDHWCVVVFSILVSNQSTSLDIPGLLDATTFGSPTFVPDIDDWFKRFLNWYKIPFYFFKN